MRPSHIDCIHSYQHVSYPLIFSDQWRLLPPSDYSTLSQSLSECCVSKTRNINEIISCDPNNLFKVGEIAVTKFSLFICRRGQTDRQRDVHTYISQKCGTVLSNCALYDKVKFSVLSCARCDVSYADVFNVQIAIISRQTLIIIIRLYLVENEV